MIIALIRYGFRDYLRSARHKATSHYATTIFTRDVILWR